MAGAFSDLDWTRFDVWTIVNGHGISVVESARVSAYRAWLERYDYTRTEIDFGQGIGPAIGALGRLLRWQEQFGYVLTPERFNLNALRDGFEFAAGAGSGHVLEIRGADVALAEDPAWLAGFLSIASEHSLRHLALGTRFFTTLIVDSGRPIVGLAYDSRTVPVPFGDFGHGA